MRRTLGFVSFLSILLLLAVPTHSAPAEGLARPMLAAHNAVRARLGLPPLEWSVELEAVAREWARSLSANGQFRHRPSNRFGENLFVIQGDQATPQFVVNSWASEAKDYNLARNTCRAGAQCGHYTQIVWRTTRQVGCAVGRRGDREVWVCNYNPPGNWEGERPY
ncbi:MAG: CAP domain-containing protein [Paludibaculum sp.]